MNIPLQRMTRQRAVILEQLHAMASHPTADELYAAVRLQLPNVSLGTIYRNLDLLAKTGSVQRLEACGGQARFDAEMTPHHHVRCRSCGRVDDVPFTEDVDIRLPVQSERGFDIDAVRVEFDGLCPDCAPYDQDNTASAEKTETKKAGTHD